MMYGAAYTRDDSHDEYESRTGDEIALDVIAKAGLSLRG